MSVHIYRTGKHLTLYAVDSNVMFLCSWIVEVNRREAVQTRVKKLFTKLTTLEIACFISVRYMVQRESNTRKHVHEIIAFGVVTPCRLVVHSS